jgi:hypothetical protein
MFLCEAMEFNVIETLEKAKHNEDPRIREPLFLLEELSRKL